MKHKTYIIFLILLFLPSTTILSQSKGDLLNQNITTYLDSLKTNQFSGVILVAKENKVLEKRAYGLANLEYNVRNNVNTKFNVASITKMFTSIAILQLYEKGKIELDKPIGIYLPNFPNKLVRDSVTVHQLLTHTSGFYNLNMKSYLETNKIKYKKNSDFIQLFINDSLVSRPGEKYNYSTTGFIVLGLIIEAVTDKSYYGYLKENVFIPSKMTNTTELEVDSIVKNKASGYTTFITKDGSLKKNDHYLFKASSGGFLYSTADDLYNFFQFLMNNKLLKKETVKLMFEPKVKGYNTYLGYGIDVDKRYNQIVLGHSGGWYGVRCEIMFFSKDNYTIVILSNKDDNGKTGTSMVSNFFKELIGKN